MEFSQEVGDPSIGMYSLIIYEHHDQIHKECASTLMGKKTPDPQLGKQVTAGYQETAPQLQWQDNKSYKPNHETIESVHKRSIETISICINPFVLILAFWICESQNATKQEEKTKKRCLSQVK